MSMGSGTQALKAGFRHRLDVFRPAVGAAAALARLKINIEAELGPDHDPVADRLQCFAKQLLIDESVL
jgi:hypothetical protein